MSSVPPHVQTALSLLPGMIPSLLPPQNGQKAAPSLANVLPAIASAVPIPVPQAPSAHAVTASSSPPSTSGTKLCDTCHIRPKYHDGTKLHPYCGKACVPKGQGASAPASNHKPPPSSTNCDHCHAKPKYFDGTRTHPYCSKTCAKNARGQTQRRNSSTICKIPGCGKPVHKDSNGKASEYCSLSHKSLAETACLFCGKVAKQGNQNYCGKQCADDAGKTAPSLLEIPSCHVTFKSVADQFKVSWRHTGAPCPTVRKVYKLVSSQNHLSDYDTYRTNVEARGQFAAAGRSAGNENRRWHGTKRECHLGDNGHTQMCSSPTCSLCRIVQTSYDLNLFGKKTGWGRFGAGIYTSSTSSKSNDYSNNVQKSPLKAILLNKVVVGKGYKMTHDNPTMTGPPQGYDSVLAEKGGSLNYDELVVYNNDAIRPSYLVMYDEH